MNECHFLTLSLLFLAHCIGDWTPYRPFDRQINDAKTNGTQRDKWFAIHSLTMASYKVFAIILSNMILPMQNTGEWWWYIWFTMLLCLFWSVELITHLVFDITKDVINLKFKLTPKNRHWFTLIGIDQFLHALIMFLVCYFLYYTNQ